MLFAPLVLLIPVVIWCFIELLRLWEEDDDEGEDEETQ